MSIEVATDISLKDIPIYEHEQAVAVWNGSFMIIKSKFSLLVKYDK